MSTGLRSIDRGVAIAGQVGLYAAGASRGGNDDMKYHAGDLPAGVDLIRTQDGDSIVS